MLVEGYVNVFPWNSIEFLQYEVEAGAVALTVVCVFKNRKPPQ